MDEHTRELLRPFAENEQLFLAVKKVVHDAFTPPTLLPHAVISDADLGQMYRAYEYGKQAVDKAFATISQCKPIPKAEPIIRHR